MLASGPPDKRASCNFVGLANQGATCYLNSLIQALYMTPELRAGLYSLDPCDHLFVNYVEEYEKQQAQEKQSGQAVDDSLLEQLKSMGLNEHGARRSLIAVKNSSADAAMEFFWANEQKAGFLDPPPKMKASKKPRLIPLELQRLFSQLQCLQQKTISTESLTAKGFQWQGYDGRAQHDAHELIRLLIDALERSLKNTPGENLCPQLYRGALSYETKCLTCETVSERREAYFDLNVQLGACDDMAKALRRYFAAEIFTGDSAYECGSCKVKCTAIRYTVLHQQLPPVLTFSCNRFRCDRTNNFVRTKITDKASFPLLLDMAPFVQGSQCAGSGEVEGEPGSDPEQTNLCTLNSRWLSLEEVLDLCLKLAALIVDKHGEQLEVDSLSRQEVASFLTFDPPQLLNTEASESDPSADDRDVSNQEAAAASARCKVYVNPELIRGMRGYDLEPLVPFKDDTLDAPHRYELFAVINHRGTAFSGHYFAYIRDCHGEGCWSMAINDGSGSASAKTGAGGNILSSDPQICGFLSLESASSGGGNGKQRSGPRYLIDGKHNVGLIYAALAMQGRPEQGGRRSLRVDDIAKMLRAGVAMGLNNESAGEVASSSASAAAGASLLQGGAGSSRGGIAAEILDVVKTHPEFFRLHGQDVHTAEAASSAEVLDSTDFAARCASFAAASAATFAGAKAKSLSWEISTSNNVTGVAVDFTNASKTANSTDETAADLAAVQDTDGWESAATTGRKKKGKKGAVAGGPPGSATSSGSIGGSHPLLTTSPILEAVASRLAGRFFGNFFEFDDTKVSSMPLAGLRKSFEGRDTAYILLYRRLQPSTSSASSAPPMPQYWQKIVSEANLELDHQRQEFEERRNKVNVTVYAHGNMSAQGPLIVSKPKPSVSSDAASDDLCNGLKLQMDGRGTVTKTIEECCMQLLKKDSSLTLTGDCTKKSSGADDTRKSLRLSKLERYGEGFYCFGALPSDALLAEVCSGSLASSSPDTDNRSLLLLWNGHDIGGEPVVVGSADDGGLVRFDVTLLEDRGETMQQGQEQGIEGGEKVSDCEAAANFDFSTSAQPLQSVVETNQSLWVRADLPISELYRLALRLVPQLDASSVIISRVEPSLTSQGCNVAKHIFKNGEILLSVTLRARDLVDRNSSTSYGQGRLLFEDSQYAAAALAHALAREVESACSSSSSSSLLLSSTSLQQREGLTLAEAWVSHRNLMWSLRIEAELEPDFLSEANANAPPPPKLSLMTSESAMPPSSPMRAQGQGLGSGGGDSAITAGALPFAASTASPAVAIEIERAVTVNDLKLRALKELFLGPNGPNNTNRSSATTFSASDLEMWAAKTCLAIGDFPSLRWALDEALPLCSTECEKNGVRNGATLYLTLWQPGLVKPAAGAVAKLSVTVTLVRGNDVSMNYNPRQPGQRGREIRLEAAPAETVRELRERAGVELMGLPPGWTLSTSPHHAAYRLREVNSQNENKQLLKETRTDGRGGAGSKTTSAHAGAAGNAAVKGGDPKNALQRTTRSTAGPSSSMRLQPPQTLKMNKLSSGARLHLEEGPPLFEGVGRYQILLWTAQTPCREMVKSEEQNPGQNEGNETVGRDKGQLLIGVPPLGLPPLRSTPIAAGAAASSETAYAGEAGAATGTTAVAIAPDAAGTANTAGGDAAAAAAAAAVSLPQPDSLDIARQRAMLHLLPIAALECHDDASLPDLYHMVFKLLCAPEASNLVEQRLPAVTSSSTSTSSSSPSSSSSSDQSLPAAKATTGAKAWLPETVDHFVLRDCRADLLPGSCFWTHDPSAATSNTLSQIGSIGMAKPRGIAGATSSATSSKARTVKSLKLTTHGSGNVKFLVVEVLPKRQQEFRPSLGPAGSFRVWAQRLVHASVSAGATVLSNRSVGSQDSEQEAQCAAEAALAADDAGTTGGSIEKLAGLPHWSCSWSYPPVEISVSGGTMPGMAHLKRPLLAAFGFPSQQPESCRVFRWNLQKSSWHELRIELKPGFKKKENLTEAPFLLSEGDLVCTYGGASTLPPVAGAVGVSVANTAATGGVVREILVSRAEDVCLQQRLELARELRRQRGSGKPSTTGSGVGSGRARVQREVMLSIGGDLAFSDDDDADDDDGGEDRDADDNEGEDE